MSGQEAAESELFLLLFPCPHFKEIFWKLYSKYLVSTTLKIIIILFSLPDMKTEIYLKSRIFK